LNKDKKPKKKIAKGERKKQRLTTKTDRPKKNREFGDRSSAPLVQGGKRKAI